MTEVFDVIVIGGGQAGLAAGYHLRQRDVHFVILDAEAEVGAVWRKRWDSLTLFTPAGYSALPGMPLPAHPDHLPGKDEIANYLGRYADEFDLPIRHREKVTCLQTDDGGFSVETEKTTYRAAQVIIATGPYQKPIIPAFAASLSEDVVQLHSSAYRSPAQLPREGNVLVVGGGNSGVQIAAEVARTRRTWLAIGRKLPALPQWFLQRNIFWWLEKLGFMSATVESRIGQHARRREFLIGKSTGACAREHDVVLLDRLTGARGRTVCTRSGKQLEISAVIWATGYTQDFSWVDAPIFDANGRVQQKRGVTAVPGLYILGLPWQHTRGSSLIGFVGRDAEYLVQRVLAAKAQPLQCRI